MKTTEGRRSTSPERSGVLMRGCVQLWKIQVACEMDAAQAGAEGSTSGLPPELGHLGSVVGLVWRSVVLWMLLVALLKLANVLG